MVRMFGLKMSIGITLVASFSIIFILGSAIIGSGILGKATREIFSFGPLAHDANGHTNILLLGVGGEKEEGGYLSDSIMILSINPNNPSVSFLSLPRDLFLNSRVGNRKINEIYAVAKKKYGERRGIEVIKDAVADFTGVEIDYGAVIDFHVFREVIDALGGVDIFVSHDIDDPFFPNGNYGYKTFVVRTGLQHFDGETALEYARSRKTSSDYDRARRQQDLILAMKEKAEALSFLTDFGKLTDFFQMYRKYVNTDLGLTQVIALAKIAMAIDYSNAISAVLNDDPMEMGGLLYTPAKEFYGGQFVLLPEDVKDTQFFMELVLIHPDVLLEGAQISVLNGSGIEGKASSVASRLRRLGFHVIEVGNYNSDTPAVETFIRDFSPQKDLETKDVLEELLDVRIVPAAEESPASPESILDLQVILGTG